MTPDDTDPSSNLTRWIGLISQRVDAYESFTRAGPSNRHPRGPGQDLKKPSVPGRRAENRKDSLGNNGLPL